MMAHGRRSVPGMMVAILVAGAILTPAVSGAAAFLTKARGDKRYLGNTSVVKSTATVPPDTGVALTASCPLGKQAVGGGAESPAFRSAGSTNSGMVITENKPIQSGTRSVGWTIEGTNLGSAPLNISAVAVCSP
jgi:hypothetical protein